MSIQFIHSLMVLVGMAGSVFAVNVSASDYPDLIVGRWVLSDG